MKTSLKKTGSPTPAALQAANQAFFRTSGATSFFGRTAAPAVQARLEAGQPGDRFEQEAERMAESVTRGSVRERAPGAAGMIQRAAQAGAPTAPDAAVGTASTGGQAMPPETRSFMEARFEADFGNVRIHADAEAASLANQLGARAFTHRNHVFFARGQYQPGTDEGRRLLAHELTHTIQQGQAPQHGAQVKVSTGAPPIQRLGLQDALDYFADKANFIPGYRLLCIVLGFNPISTRRTDRSAANILRALVELLPGGALITQALDAHGVFARAGSWVEQQLATLGDIGEAIVAGLHRFVDSLGWRDIFDLGGVWDRAKAIFTTPISRLIAFGTSVVVGLMRFVREAVLRPLARLAEGTSGYDLLKAVLGMDPITGEPVPRTADNLIGGFMKLIGQEEVWQNIKRGNAVARAWAWFQGALAGLMGFVRSIPGRIVDTLASITWQDVLTIAGLFGKVGRTFLGIAGQFISWAGAQVLSLLEILLTVVAPGAIPYLRKARGAFATIVRNPVGFVGNLVRSAKLGFQMFAANIGFHLKNALIRWLVGPLADAGVYIPKSFDLLEVVKLVLSVLGLTWQNIRAKLVRIIPEPVLQALERTAGILVTLVRDGPAAAWEQIKGELAELKNMLVAKVTEMVTSEVVKAAVAKVAMMLNPAGAVIQAIIAIYNTISFFIQKINQIGAVVATFIDSIAAIAAGQVGGAAQAVERTLANTLTLIIAFMARFVGLGGIPDKLVGIVRKIRAPIDRGLDKVVAWLGDMLKKVTAAAKAGVKRLLQWWKRKVPVSGGDEQHTLTFDGEGENARLMLHSAPAKPSVFLEATGKAKKITDENRKTPVETAQEHEKKLDPVMKALQDFDKLGKNDAAPAGKDLAKADKLAGDLDKKLAALATHIGATLTVWKVNDAPIAEFKLPRSTFTIEQKANLAAMYEGTRLIKKNADGQKINVAKGMARRHVVSSHDMATHYAETLTGKKVSEGKLLLEQRTSMAGVGTQVKKLNQKGIVEAASERYSNFFGYTRNLFIGNSRENSRIQQHLDAGNPAMADQLLEDHVAHVKRAWALNQKIKISRLDEK